jgi:osmoprotectant transport system ATP-binding protein
MISLQGVTKVFPNSSRPAVGDLSFDVAEGELVALVGPSGCGKTTTLKMINRLIEPSGGTILVNGVDVMQQDPVQLRRGIGYVIQSVGLMPHQTIERNIATVPHLLGWDEERIAGRTKELVALFDLDPAFLERYPGELSGGQRQRVGVARALAADPGVMLMDEPFAAVDPIVRARLQDEFLRLQDDLGKTVVLVTHDIDEAVKMGDKVAVMAQGGHLAQFGTPAQLLGHPADDFVADFVGSTAGLRRLTVTKLDVAHLEPLDGIATGDLGAAIDLGSTLEHALAVLLRDDKPMVGVKDGARFVGVLTPDGIHRALRASLAEEQS